MSDNNFLAPVQRGNRSANQRIGIIESANGGAHATLMGTWPARMCPDAEVVWGHTSEGHSVLGRLATPPGDGRPGCGVIAMPFADDIPLTSLVPGWDQMIPWCVENGVLLFAGVGNGSAVTQWPANRPGVYACGSGLPSGMSQSGKVDIIMFTGSHMSSGASVAAACAAAQWLEAGGVYLFSRPQDRKPGFDFWLRQTGIPQPRGVAPDCSRL